MGDFIAGVLFFALIGLSVYNAQGCANREIEKQIIKDGGFCVRAEQSGQKFERCFELKLKE